jgi:beta-galactosidase
MRFPPLAKPAHQRPRNKLHSQRLVRNPPTSSEYSRRHLLRGVFAPFYPQVTQSKPIYPNERNAFFLDGREYEICDYAERIHLEGARELGKYVSDFYAGESAVTVNEYGKGKAYYIAARDTGELKDKIIGDILAELDIKGHIKSATEGVTAHSREDEDNIYLFVENYTAEPADAEIYSEGLDMESGTPTEKLIKISPYGVRIIKIKK